MNGGQQVPNDKGLGNLAISEDGSSGVKRGQATVGEDYKFSFLQLKPGSTTLTSNGTVFAHIDNTFIQTPVSAGETASQVASNLAQAMSANGIPIVLNGDTISFIQNSSHVEALSTDLGLNATGLEGLISIPERQVTTIPEPAPYAMFLAGLGAVGWCVAVSRRRSQVKKVIC